MTKGFTLLEILIAITLFSIVVVGFLNLFTSAFRYQKESLNSAYLLNTASFLSEYLSRALRVAQKESSFPPTCLSQYGLNYEIIGGGEGIRFINSQGECQSFFLENNTLMIQKGGIFQPLTPSNLRVENLKFEIVGEAQDDFSQPKVTFILKLKLIGDSSQALNFQTTISQRDLDIRY